MVVPNRGWPIDVAGPEFLHEVMGELTHILILKRGQISIEFRFQILFGDRSGRNETGKIDVVAQYLLALDDFELKLLVIEEDFGLKVHDVARDESGEIFGSI